MVRSSFIHADRPVAPTRTPGRRLPPPSDAPPAVTLELCPLAETHKSRSFPHPILRIVAVLALLALTLLVCGTARGEWGKTPDTALQVQGTPWMETDGDGGAWFYSVDGYFFHLDRYGNPIFRDWISAILSAECYYPKVIHTDDGGVLAMIEVLETLDNDSVEVSLRAQRITKEGKLLWGDAGIRLFNWDGMVVRPQEAIGVVTDGEGGMIVIGSHALAPTPLPYKMIPYAQRISRDGELMWDSSGVPGGFNDIKWDENTRWVVMIADGVGGVIVASESGYPKQIDIQRIDSNGEPVWGDSGSSALPMPEGTRGYLVTDIISDDRGGCILALDYKVKKEDSLIHRGVEICHITDVGALDWIDNVYDRPELDSDWYIPEFTPVLNKLNGAYCIAWSDHTKGNFFQLVKNGNLIWDDPHGISVETADFSRDIHLIPTQNGLWFVWWTYREDAVHQCRVVAQKIDSEGVPCFLDNDITVNNHYNQKYNLFTCSDCNDGFIMTIGNRVQEVNKNGELGIILPVSVSERRASSTASFPSIQLYPQPANNTVTISYPFTAKIEIPYVITDISGRGMLNGSFNGTLSTVSLSSFPSGYYLLSFGSGSKIRTTRFIVLK